MPSIQVATELGFLEVAFENASLVLGQGEPSVNKLLFEVHVLENTESRSVTVNNTSTCVVSKIALYSSILPWSFFARS